VDCADLVATQLVASPGYTGLGVTTQTFTAQIVNVGDTATALNPATDTLFDFVVYAQTGTFSVGTPTFSDPAFAPLCTTTTIPGAAPYTQIKVSCKGNLGPSQGLTITLPVSSVTGDLVSCPLGRIRSSLNGTSTPPEFRRTTTSSSSRVSLLKMCGGGCCERPSSFRSHSLASASHVKEPR
jgi:hypothetical protein